MRKLTIVFILLGFVASCGQKGLLYHSESGPEQTKKDTNKQEDKK